jgi:hypothetical protein
MSRARPALSTRLQLHMTVDDVDEVVAELQPTCRFGYFTDRTFKGYLPAEGTLASRPRIGMLRCSMHPWEGPHDDETRFLDANHGVLSLEVPRVRDGRIEEVMMGAKVRDDAFADRIASWAKFLRRYRRRLHSGAWITNTRTGAQGYYANAHATAQALAAARGGIALTGPNGGTRYEFGPPDEA